ncbi:MAG TPA: OmpA family protein, partial [Novosphingobium sp.]|nr:OmpA family protein [Novosphingobium sp.]
MLSRFPRNRTLILLAVSATALAACAPKPPKQLPPEPGPTVAAAPAPAPVPSGPTPGSQADFLASIGGRDTIHFAFDKYNVDDLSVEILKTQAAWLLKYPAKKATIEGHADERGTREYNIALGARRAQTAREYLVSRGIDAQRMRTISYGKERPVAVCNDISCWS